MIGRLVSGVLPNCCQLTRTALHCPWLANSLIANLRQMCGGTAHFEPFSCNSTPFNEGWAQCNSVREEV